VLGQRSFVFRFLHFFPSMPATPPARNDADDGRNPRQGADPGERRRTPESRYTPRER